MSKNYRKEATPFPCGQCFNCRVNKSREWALRICLEMLDHEYSSFVTLTYNNFFLPGDAELYPDDVKAFFKRLRQKFYNKKTKEYTRKIKYYYCGEYGSNTGRPHYHIALFGCGIQDTEKIEDAWQMVWKDKDENKYYSYPLGLVHVGDINKYSARYISGYIMKGANSENYRKAKNKYFKKRVEDHLQGRKCEFQRMSRRPGLGKDRIKKITRNLGGITGRFRAINWQKKAQPIGKYLQSVVDEELNITDEQKQEEFDSYSMKLFDEYFNENERYLNSLIRQNEQKERNRKARMNIYMSNAKRRKKI